MDESGDELRVETSLRQLSVGSELSLVETHEALHQLMDQKLVRLDGQALIAPDRAALASALTRLARAS